MLPLLLPPVCHVNLVGVDKGVEEVAVGMEGQKGCAVRTPAIGRVAEAKTAICQAIGRVANAINARTAVCQATGRAPVTKIAVCQTIWGGGCQNCRACVIEARSARARGAEHDVSDGAWDARSSCDGGKG